LHLSMPSLGFIVLPRRVKLQFALL
jgi:hypothetical protein